MTTEHLAGIVTESAERYGTRPAMRYQVGSEWRSISYREFEQRVRATAKGLLACGVQAGDTVGIFSGNRPEWSIADFAILSVGAISVPIYATNTAQQAQFIVDDAGLSVLFVGGQRQLDSVVEFRPDTPQLRTVVAFDDEGVQPTGTGFVSFDAFESEGTVADLDDELATRQEAIAPDAPATLIYTSGTTGVPKGAVLTHASFFHQLRALDERFQVGPDDVSLCFLPLSHAYERGWSCYVFHAGAENCYLLDPKNVVAAMADVRPTLMVSVPRLYEKVHAGVMDQVDRGSALKRRLFRWGLAVGGKYQHRLADGKPIGPVLRAEHALADRLVLAKIRDVIGGPKNVFSAGGAPLAKEIEEFFFAAGVFVCQGYGLTETTAMVSCNAPGAFRFGTVGLPVAGTEVKIADDGEILVRGGNVMTGYHGRADDTAAAFVDGWFRTGDVGAIDDAGFLTVTDRIKDLIITSQGKNVAPQRIEGILGADPYIEQIVVIGDNRKYLCALIEPGFPVLERYAEEHGVAFGSREELIVRPEIQALYEERIAARSGELAGYERVRRFTLLPREFSQAEGELTPTLKIRRRMVEQQYAGIIEAMYEAPSAAA